MICRLCKLHIVVRFETRTPLGSGKRARGTSISSASRVAAASKQGRATEPISGEESEHSEVEQPRKRTKRKKSEEDEVETVKFCHTFTVIFLAYVPIH